jgi:hypothetical protein
MFVGLAGVDVHGFVAYPARKELVFHTAPHAAYSLSEPRQGDYLPMEGRGQAPLRVTKQTRLSEPTQLGTRTSYAPTLRARLGTRSRRAAHRLDCRSTPRSTHCSWDAANRRGCSWMTARSLPTCPSQPAWMPRSSAVGRRSRAPAKASSALRKGASPQRYSTHGPSTRVTSLRRLSASGIRGFERKKGLLRTLPVPSFNEAVFYLDASW